MTVSTMNDDDIGNLPAALAAILDDTRRIGFTMASEPKTGSLLRCLAASKPAGRFLELGTGTGVGTAWLLDGMDDTSRLDSVDNDAKVQDVARLHLGRDPRVTFHCTGAADFLARQLPRQFDLIYADAWPGKFERLDLTLDLVALGGIYFVDDLLPQANWPDGHAPKVEALIRDLESRIEFAPARLAWASGLMLLVRVS
jgi:predicted O-methyltransferase YrrM